jgi:hypothetical protein
MGLAAFYLIHDARERELPRVGGCEANDAPASWRLVTGRAAVSR